MCRAVLPFYQEEGLQVSKVYPPVPDEEEAYETLHRIPSMLSPMMYLVEAHQHHLHWP